MAPWQRPTIDRLVGAPGVPCIVELSTLRPAQFTRLKSHEFPSRVFFDR